MFLGNVMLEIALVSLVMVGVSQVMQRKFIDKKMMKENQDKMKEHQGKIKELAGKEDGKSKAEAERRQQEMLELMNKTMSGTMKHMLFSFPVFIGVFWGLSYLFSGVLIEMPFAVPIIHRNFSFEITTTISWLWWYIYSSFAISMALNVLLKVLERRGAKK